MFWQLIVVAVLVTCAACYLARAAWRSWSARKAGCGGGCGCSTKSDGADAHERGTFIPVDQITFRRDTHSAGTT